MFVLGLKGLELAQVGAPGMALAEFGMLLAVVGTLFHHAHRHATGGSRSGFAIGAVVGGTMGLRIPMTAVPQRTALSHSLGALAACLVGISEYFRYQGDLGRVTLTALGFQVVIGALTFTGSLMAAAKLQELLPRTADHLPGPERHQPGPARRHRRVRDLPGGHAGGARPSSTSWWSCRSSSASCWSSRSARPTCPW